MRMVTEPRSPQQDDRAEDQCPHRARQDVGRNCKSNEEAYPPCRGGSYREPGDRYRAHPVAER